MSNTSPAARISSHSTNQFKKQFRLRRQADARRNRSNSSIWVLSLCLLVIVLGICAAPKRLMPVRAQHTTPAQGDCCGMKPPGFTASSNFGGQIAIVTGQLVGASSVVVVDLKNENAEVPVDTNWTSGSNPSTQIRTDPRWALTSIGDVFGVTLDDLGNVYVTATTSYYTKSPVTTANPGRIYRIDGTTGVVNTFITLPNEGPALGNIHYSCRHKSFYVSNFADGRISQVVNGTSTTGSVRSTFDHQTGTIESGFFKVREQNTDYAQFSEKNPQGTTKGGRVWGLAVYRDRLYYGVWRQDTGQHTGSNNKPNEVWSIGLSAGGTFTGTATREITLPPNIETNPWPTANPTNTYSNPVASISFSPTGDMLLAERSMSGDRNNDAQLFARHASRLLEYSRPNPTSGWTILTVAAANKFGIGAPHPPSSNILSGRPSAAGGADYDLAGGRVWATGDALHLQGFPYSPDVGPSQSDYIYGIQGFPMSGGTIHNSLLISLTPITTDPDNKNQMGDVEIPCPACK